MHNIILLHGALGDEKELRPLAMALKNYGFKTHSFSFSGHGESAYGKTFGIPSFAGELKEFIVKEKITNPVVFGYSMGGYVALHAVTEDPHLLRAIVTLNTKFKWDRDIIAKQMKFMEPVTMKEKTPDFARQLEKLHKHGWMELLSKTSEMLTDIGAKNYLRPSELKKISTAVLIGLADKDQIVSLEETVDIYKGLPNASMYMLPGTRHQLETVNNDLLGKIIFEFLKKL
jgi:esterase/lipase